LEGKRVSLIAIVDLAHPDMALMPTLETCPEMRTEVVSHSSTDPETGKFFFLIKNQPSDFESVIEADHTVQEWTIVDDTGSTTIYRIEHTPETKLISTKTVELGGLLLKAISNGPCWTVRLHLPNREALSGLWEYCDTEDISFELNRMFRQDDITDTTAAGLTEAQRVALKTAYEKGYFEEPRETSLEDLATDLDISPTSVGGRIRRGTGRLIESVLLED
jgi:predicted DNA binding protein